MTTCLFCPEGKHRLQRQEGCQDSVSSSRCFELNHAHRLCGSPSTFEFHFANVLQVEYLLRLRRPRSHWPRHLVFIVYGVEYQGINPVCSPRFRASVSVTVQQAAFATGVLLISTHFTATLGIPPASPVPSYAVSNAPGLSPAFHLT